MHCGNNRRVKRRGGKQGPESEQNSILNVKCLIKHDRAVLCPARGLKGNHNTNTAILNVPENAPHGLLLICSHLECANSNRRFRYCKVCDIPVAKKNFLSLHSHDMIEAEDIKREVDNVYGAVRGSMLLRNSFSWDAKFDVFEPQTNLLARTEDMTCIAKNQVAKSCADKLRPVIILQDSKVEIETIPNLGSSFYQKLHLSHFKTTTPWEPQQQALAKYSLEAKKFKNFPKSLAEDPDLFNTPRMERPLPNLKQVVDFCASDFPRDNGDAYLPENLNSTFLTSKESIDFFEWFERAGEI